MAGTILSPTAFLIDEQISRIKLVASTSLSSEDGFSSKSIEMIHFQSYKKIHVRISSIFIQYLPPKTSPGILREERKAKDTSGNKRKGELGKWFPSFLFGLSMEGKERKY